MADKIKTLPLIALKDIVIFPYNLVPISIGREKSINALIAAKQIEDNESILIVGQKDQDISDPEAKDLYRVGVIAKIIQTITLPNNNAKMLIESIDRVKFLKIHNVNNSFTAEYSILPEENDKNTELVNKHLTIASQLFKEYALHNKKVNNDILEILNDQHQAGYVIDVLSHHLTLPTSKKQQILEEINVLNRINLFTEIITSELNKIYTEQVLQKRVKTQIEKTQRDYYLQEQMKAIQKELDGSDKSDFGDLEKKLKNTTLSKEAREKAENELRKLKMMNQMSAESSVVRNYLETLLNMPWSKMSNNKTDIIKAQQILDRDHFGLEKVKERIIEFLAILQRSKKINGSILCLIGPPGVGKTSLVKSIAESLGRKYTKFSLGGIRDEAEIRGHRKTYLGSMPGKIISLIKKCKTDNPVMLLDEIDKMGYDMRGDPASALLEVLDPEQNSHFSDHYLEVEYDVSNVIFIATANTYNLPRALLDRVEIINIAGYIESEKVQIAKNYLIPKQLKLHGMKKRELTITDEAILDLIRYYTKESGVRSLEREISALTRKALKKILTNTSIKSIKIKPENIKEFLGAKKYRIGLANIADKIGLTTGLAYTEVGGDLLNIEAVSFPGKGEIKTTGQLGDVMKESAQAAYSCFRTNADELGLKYEDYKDLDIHVHVPEGAIPKDGPSAGIAIFTTIVSLMTKTPVHKDVAMTGEITLTGRVLPIGGLKEKLLAATRGGITTVLIPEDNVKDLDDIPANIKDNLKLLPVSDLHQVLKIALVN